MKMKVEFNVPLDPAERLKDLAGCFDNRKPLDDWPKWIVDHMQSNNFFGEELMKIYEELVTLQYSYGRLYKEVYGP